MQNLLAKYSKHIVKGGPLQGTNFSEVPRDKILKAAKRYSGDPDFAKFSRSYALLCDLEEPDVPEPRVPLVACNPVKADSSHFGVAAACKRFVKSLVVLCWKSKLCRWSIIFACVALLLRPAFSKMMSKVVVTMLRVGLRRVSNFIIAILEGLLDELIYQMDFMIRDALPFSEGLQETVIASFNWASHLVSNGLGAAVALLVQFRRAQIQVQ